MAGCCRSGDVPDRTLLGAAREIKRGATLFCSGPFNLVGNACRLLSKASSVRNGELLVLNRLSARGAAAIFDVGANVGYWALTAARVNPSATIHSFEIVPETFAAFVENTKTYGRIVANAIGLSDREGTVPVHVADGVNSVHFSAVTPFANGRRVECPMTRGDLYAARAGIERIDFLKIDVEGGEYDVLMGFSDMLGRGTIGLIQFEYGSANIDSRKLLKDYYNLLT